MVAATGRVEAAAAAIAQRTAQILGASASILDEQGLLLARSRSGEAAQAEASPEGSAAGAALEVPVMLDGRACRLLVGLPHAEAATSRHLAQAVIELVISQAAIVEQLPSREALKNRFVHNLLRGEIEDEAAVRREGQILGVDLSRPRAVLLIDAAKYILPGVDPTGPPETEERSRRGHARTRLVIAAIVRFFGLPNDAICAYIGDGEIAVLKASTTQDLAGWAADSEPPSPSWANLVALKRAGKELLDRLQAETGAEISIGIGRYHPGIRGLARSSEDARAALSLGRRLRGAGQLHALDNLGVAAFVGIADEETKSDLARHLLSPLDQEPDLLETLDAFFAGNCCPSAVAARIPIHRNTLGYRLDKIASLTGLDPRRFDDAVQIRLALVLRSLAGEGLGY